MSIISRFRSWIKGENPYKKPGSSVETSIGAAVLLDIIEKCAALKGPGRDAKLTYISTPVTSTLRFLLDKNLVYGQLSAADKQAIKDKYGETAQKVTRDTRRGLGRRDEVYPECINPFPLFIPGWGQADYMQFWLFIIRNYVGRMVMCPDWEYSAGCVEELMTAYLRGIPCYDHLGGRIYGVDALSIVGRAVAQARGAGHEDCQLVKIGDKFLSCHRYLMISDSKQSNNM